MNVPFDPWAVLDGFVDPLVVLNLRTEIVYANRQFRCASGSEASPIEGKPLAEVWPAIHPILDHARYLHAINSGECVRFEHELSVPSIRSEIVVQLFAEGLAIVVLRDLRTLPQSTTNAIETDNNSKHPHASLHSRMLAHMGSCLRADLGAAETFYQMACILGQLPDVSRATFGTVDNDARTITIHRDFCRGVPSMAGTYLMNDAEASSRELSQGQIVIISDVRTDYRSRDGVEYRYKMGYLACVAIPLMRGDIWAATLMVSSARPREWSADEVELIRTAAERTWLAVENARLLQEARHANAAKDQFLAMLSHELRTPLTPVVMMLSELQQSESLDPDLKQNLAMIRRNIDLETRLIDDLLDITRIANGKLQLALRPTLIHELLEHVIQICLADAHIRGVELSCQFGACRDVVEGDAARLEQVFWNLIKNAIKFTPAGGRVRITTTTEGPELLVEVRDTGAGIAPEVLPHIFQAFEQGGKSVTRAFGGLGLGLAISKAIVDLHNGRIWATSEGKTHGSTFSIALPVMISGDKPPETERPIQAHNHDEPGRARPLHVLLVDDNADTLRTMKRLLTSRGMQVTTATKIGEALDAATKISFGLIISDIGLPDGSGCELMEVLRMAQTVPAIALSGYGMETDIQRSLAAGFTAHLVKPVSFEELEKGHRENYLNRRSHDTGTIDPAD